MASGTNDKDDCPSHFTNKSPACSDTLEQGGLLLKMDALRELLKEVHPHYLKEDYSHFMILTQSCDLVKRSSSKIKARYLSLAAVRPLDLLIQREIEKEQKHELDKLGNLLSDNKKRGYDDFLRKLLDNQNSGYFYLHQEPSFSLPNNSCAFLRLSISIAIRTEEHYEKCLKARVLTLNDTFKAKLGWLVGDMYSRVGTEDWVPNYMNKKELKTHIDQLINEHCFIVDSKLLDGARKEWAKTNGDKPTTKEEVREFLSKVVTTSKRTKVVDRIQKLISQMDINLSSENIELIGQTILNDPFFQNEVKDK